MPRELAHLIHLVDLKMNECPMKDRLNETYNSGIGTMHSEFNRKNIRKLYKEELFKNLTEWKYPSENKEVIFDHVEEIFSHLKDSTLEGMNPNGALLKRLIRNF